MIKEIKAILDQKDRQVLRGIRVREEKKENLEVEVLYGIQER